MAEHEPVFRKGPVRIDSILSKEDLEAVATNITSSADWLELELEDPDSEFYSDEFFFD